MRATPRDELAAMSRASERSGFELIGHSSLGGWGDGMQVVRHGRYLYVGHTGHGGGALTVLDCADPREPVIVHRIPHAPNTRSHKVQIADGLLLQNAEFPYFGDPSRIETETVRGVIVYSLEDPREPRRIGFHAVGGRGAHRIWYDGGRYAHVAACRPGEQERGYQIIDLADPVRPTLAGEWSLPGTNGDEGEPWPSCVPEPWYQVHGIIAHGDTAYVSCEDAGLAILDIADPASPTVTGALHWPAPGGGMTHTALPLPGRDLAVVTEEQLDPAQEERTGRAKRVWLVDIADPAAPRILSAMPMPEPAAGGSYAERPGRFGPHNIHENRAGSFRSERWIFGTYFNAGLRLWDIADAEHPREAGHFVPPAPAGQASPQWNDLWVDAEGLVYATDRRSGLYILESTVHR